MQDRLPKEYLSIANDSLGNFIILNLITKKIYLFDHEIEKKILISDTFNEYIKSFYSFGLEESKLDREISNQNLSYFNSLIKNGKNINSIKNEFDQTVTTITSLSNKLKLLKFFIENGASYDGALFNACMNGHIEVVKYLLIIGANPNERDIDDDSNNDTALITASLGGYLSIVKLLLENGADIKLMDKNGYSAFDKAQWSNNDDLKSFFLGRIPI